MTDCRRHLPIELGQSLTEPWVRQRATMQQVVCHPKIKDAMKRIGVVDAETRAAQPAKDRRRGLCFLCPRQREQKVEVACSKCGNFVCGGHSQKTTVCNKCSGAE